MDKKQCSKCGKEKNLADFYKYTKFNSKYGDGHNAQCKKCKDEVTKKYRSTPEARKKLNLRVNRYNKTIRIKCINHYGGVCACCGENRIEFLVIDHINGGGNKEREKTKGSGGWKFAVWLKQHNYPEGYRVLCHNCNSSLGFYGYCPHNLISVSIFESVEEPSAQPETVR